MQIPAFGRSPVPPGPDALERLQAHLRSLSSDKFQEVFAQLGEMFAETGEGPSARARNVRAIEAPEAENVYPWDPAVIALVQGEGRRRDFIDGLTKWVSRAPSAEERNVREGLARPLIAGAEAANWPEEVELLDWSSKPVTEIPVEIGLLSHLTNLILHGTRITTLPPEVGKLVRLEVLDLGETGLAVLPPAIGRLSKLTELDLEGTSIATLPPEIGELAELEWLSCAATPMTYLPSELGRCTRLTHLELTATHIEVLPPEMGTLVRLRQLDLSNTLITALPREIGQLTRLQGLDLSATNLREVPAAIGELHHLTKLNLSNTPITALPSQIGALRKLAHLNLSHTQVVNLPPEIGHLQRLVELNLSETPLAELPREVRELSDLKRLDASHTQLRTLPPRLHELASLQVVNLEATPLVAALPTTLEQLRVAMPREIVALAYQGCDVQGLSEVIADHLENRRFELEAESPIMEEDGVDLERQDAFGFGIHPANLLISRATLNHNPTVVLEQVAHHITERPDLDLIVHFPGEPGIDVGGLRKSLWTDLSKALFRDRDSEGHWDPERLPAQRSGVNAEKPEGDGWIPEVRQDHREKDQAHLVSLGKMMSWGAQRGLLMAPVLASDLFAAIHSCITHEDPLRVVQKLMHDKSIDLLFKETGWTDEEWLIVCALADSYLEGLPGEEEQQKTFVRANLAVLKRAIVDEPVQRSYLQMVHALIDGLASGAPGEVERLRELSPAQIMARYQGSLDAAKFVDAVTSYEQERLAGQVGRSDEEEARLNLLNERLTWLKNWIRYPLEGPPRPEDPQWEAHSQLLRRRLLNEITARESLLANEKINLLVVGAGERPSFHTCFNRFDLPVDISTEEDFREALRNLMAVQDQGFNEG